ncbi:hypothetical protein [Dactylosporangium sp. NPDC051541]|uniref:hypothetical protein n=1 Tax=Dactylosporangium sp. NPDC051541 TaxID=3363977 RepID=UPI0037A72C2C
MTSAPRALCAAAMTCSALAAAGLLAPAPAPLRAAVTLVFCCWVPGVTFFAVLRAWQLARSPAATIAFSLSAVIALSQVSLALGVWRPAVCTGAFAAACCALLAMPVFVPRLAGARW